MVLSVTPGAAGRVRSEPAPGAPLPDNAVWLDLNQPTPQEEQQVEQVLGTEVPSREQMREIESSNRLAAVRDRRPLRHELQLHSVGGLGADPVLLLKRKGWL